MCKSIDWMVEVLMFARLVKKYKLNIIAIPLYYPEE